MNIGDKVLVPSGTRVPVGRGADGAPSALMDRSLLTGESAAVTLSDGDTLQAGEVNLGAPLQLRRPRQWAKIPPCGAWLP